MRPPLTSINTTVTFFILCLAFCGVTYAAELNVPDDYPTIQSAIDAASDGDHIVLANGIYTGDGNTSFSYLNKAITVESINGSCTCFIDYEENPGQVTSIQMSTREGMSAVLRGVTIRNSTWTAMETGEGMLLIEGCSFENNNDIQSAGAIEIPYGNLVFRNSRFLYNFSEGVGGAIKCNRAEILFDNTHFLHNGSRQNGGALYSTGCNLSFRDCSLLGNSTDYGGGVFQTAQSTVISLDSCHIQTNHAMSGGVIRGSDTSFTMTSTELHYNTSPVRLEDSSISIINCLFFRSNNYAIQLDRSGGSIVNSTFIDSVAHDRDIGVIYCTESSSPQITNCIIWDNGLDPIGLADESCEPIVTYCNVQNGYPGTGNIDIDPMFVAGPYGDFYLSQRNSGQPDNSPCIDQGDTESSEICYDTIDQPICLSVLTTGSNNNVDMGIVDIGYHYYPDTFGTSTPTFVPTSSPTPGEPTATPTLTQTPTCSPAPTSTSTPTATPTPVPTATPSDGLGVNLLTPETIIAPGDQFYLDLEIINLNPESFMNIPLFCLLEINGSYWFHPNWTTEVDWTTLTELKSGETIISAISAFTWPADSGSGSATFLGALTDSSVTQIMGSSAIVEIQWRE